MTEISTRVAGLQAAAAARGTPVMAPLLVLGTSERVGSNWLSDTLGKLWQQHNEPLRQQLASTHPVSSTHPDPVRVESLTDVALDPLGWHWLVTFAVGKYSPVRQVIKETNLFFATPGLLALFPDAPVVIASRSPLGVVSSFRRGRLFARWGYADRYAQLAAAATRPPWRRWAPLLPADDPGEVVALVRLVVANALLLAEAIAGRRLVHVPYEAAAVDQAAALAAVGDLIGERLVFRPTPPAATGGGDDTFATTGPAQPLRVYLDPGTAEQVRASTAAALFTARGVVSAAVLERATGWLAGDRCYHLAGPARPRPPAPPVQAVVGVRPRSGWVPLGGLDWRNLLVSNIEYAAFLNALASVGMVNTHGGAHLLAVPMPAERGGRLHPDGTGRWAVQPGYEHHPVYWVTWIGAAAYAAAAGARLPTRAECNILPRGVSLAAINAAYRHGDATGVVDPRQGPGQIHHPIGNVQIWCADGPGPGRVLGGPAGRWLHGAAWNTPATVEQVCQARSRHPLGASRGVGIRLVRDDGPQTRLSAGEVAGRLHGWIASLVDRDRWSLAELDSPLLAALGGLQADGRLGAHVGTGAGEP